MSLPGEWAYWLGVVQIHSAKNVEEAAQVTLSALGLSRTAHARVNPTSVGNPPRTDRLVTHEAQIRSALIQSAAAGGTLQIAIERVKRIGASAQDVMAVAEHLRDAQLLRFDGQLTPRTVIRLN
jgi:flagellar basal body P-ring protein FlgI